MEKKIYLLRGTKTERYADFKNRIVTLVNEVIQKNDIKELKLVITESAPPKFTIIPFKRHKVAVVSVKHDSLESLPGIENTNGFAGVYAVTEATPVVYSKDWEDGLPTPGICLLTLFKQRMDINYDTFIDRWHNSHTPLSIKLHPLWNYNRNVVDKQASSNKESWDGIVEEHFKTKSDLLNPFKFFGNIFRIIPNMLAVYLDTQSFIDYKTIEPYLAMEYHIKS